MQDLTSPDYPENVISIIIIMASTATNPSHCNWYLNYLLAQFLSLFK